MTAKKEFADKVLTAVKAGAKTTHEILAHMRIENDDNSRQKVRAALKKLTEAKTIKAKKEQGEFKIEEA